MAEIAGLKLIVPSSVSAGGSASASVSASGKVTFTDINNTDALVIEDCFSSTYDNYLMVIRLTASSTGYIILGRYRVSGSDATGTNYTYQRIVASSTTINAGRDTSQTSFAVMRSAATSSAHVYFYGPNLAQPTASRSVTIDDQGGSVRIYDYAATHSLSTAYTSLTLFINGADNTSGTITIYGLSQ